MRKTLAFIATTSCAVIGACVSSGSRDFRDLALWKSKPSVTFGGKMPWQAKPVVAIAVSPDGNVAASAGSDGIVYVWDLETGVCLRRFDTNRSVSTLGFDKAGKRLFFFAEEESTEDSTLTIAGLDGNLHPRSFRLEEARSPVAMSPDWTVLVTLSPHGLTKVWEMTQGKAVGEPFNDKMLETGMVVSPDNRLLIVAGFGGYDGEGQMVAIDLVSRKQQWTISDPNLVGGCIAMSRDGNTLFAVPAPREHNPVPGKMSVFDVQTGMILGSFPIEGVLQLQTTADGRYLAGITEDAFLLWEMKQDASSLRQVARIDIPLLQSHIDTGVPRIPIGFSLSRNGEVMACSRIGDEVPDLWDVPMGRRLRSSLGHTHPVKGMAFERGGRAVLSVGLDGTVRRWSLVDGNESGTVRDLGEAHQCLAISADGRTVASYSGRPRPGITVRDIESGKEVGMCPTRREPDSTALSPDGQILATATGEGIQLWHCLSGKSMFSLEEVRPRPGESQKASRKFLALAFSPDGKMLACCDESGLRIVELATREETMAIPHALAPDRDGGCCWNGKFIAIGQQNLRLFDVVTRSWALISDTHGEGVTAVAVSERGHFIATAGSDMRISVWERPGYSAESASPAASALEGGQRPNKPETSSAGSARTTENPLPAGTWDALASSDSEKAWKAVSLIVEAREAGVALLKDHLKPTPPSDPAIDVASLVSGLDSDSVRTREQSSRLLAEIGEPARLMESLKTARSIEVRLRITEILAKLADPTTRDLTVLRANRSVLALELIADEPDGNADSGHAAARELLGSLAGGGPSRLTRDASSALSRCASPGVVGQVRRARVP